MNERRRNGVRAGLGACVALWASALATAQGLPPEPVVRLDPAQAAELVRSPRWLALRSGGFDTRSNEPELALDLRRERDDATAKAVFLVQFSGPSTSGLRARVAATGVELVEALPTHAFLARGSGEQRAALERLGETAWTGELHPAWRLDPRLEQASAERALANEVHELVALGFQGGDLRELGAALARHGLTKPDLRLEQGRAVARFRASAAVARRLAREEALQWIEPAPQLTLRNNALTWVLQTNQPQQVRLWDRGLRGEGQVIGHIDGAISPTNCWFRDPANAPVGPTHRKLVYVSGTGADTHGTHTAGTIAGDSAPISGSTSGRGLAYLARLAHTDFPALSFAATASAHALAGARIHSNSWGDDTTTAYNSLCVALDTYAHDNEDELVIFSVSNTPFVTNPDNAKNVLAVGATDNGVNAGLPCVGAVGPTNDGRRRPEVLAPGCSVVSATPGPCTTLMLTGTSMSAAGISGAAALVRQYFTDGFHPSGRANPAHAFVPSGALLKAVLVQAGQDLASVAGYPSDREGWGRVNLDSVLHLVGDEAKLFVAERRHAQGLSTNEDTSWTVFVQSSATPFEVTLAFMDAPAALNASLAPVNDLDLELVSPSGALFRGNVFANGLSVPGGASDPLNNVEHFELANPQVGAWTVRVRANDVPVGPQGFALCATGDISEGSSSMPTRYCTSSLTTNFCTPVLHASGVARAGATSGFTLAVSGVEGQRQGVIFYGLTGRTAVRWKPQSSSWWCVRNPVQRTGSQSSGGTFGGCDGLLSVDWSQFAAASAGALGVPFAPGQLVQAQAWFRDPMAPGQSNLSDALEFTVQP